MSRSILAWTLCISAFAGGLCEKAQGQDAAAMEEQYKTCAKHYIPADKCTPEIYKQLKDKDNAPLEPNVAAALAGVKEYRKRLKNPASLQVHTAYVTDKGNVCLKVSGQNTLGGQTVDRVVFTSEGKLDDGSGWKQAFAPDDSLTHPGGGVDRWERRCVTGFHQKLVPGTDVTDKVNQALKEGK